MRQEHLWMFGGFSHGNGVGKAQAEPLDIFEGLSAAVRPIHKTKVMEMNITSHMSIGGLLRKDGEKSILLFNSLCKGEIGCLRSVRDIRILFIGMEDELVHIIKGHTQPGVHLAGLFQTPFNQFGVNQFADQRRGNHFDLGSDDQILHFPGNLFCRIDINISFSEQGIDDPLTIPIVH